MPTTTHHGISFDFPTNPDLPILSLTKDDILSYLQCIQGLLAADTGWREIFEEQELWQALKDGEMHVWLYGYGEPTGIVLWSFCHDSIKNQNFVQLNWTYGDFKNQRGKIFNLLEDYATILKASYIETDCNPVWASYMTSKLGYEVESLRVRKPINYTKGMH